MIRRLFALRDAVESCPPPTVEIERDSAEYQEVRKIITEKLKQKRERTIEIPPVTHGQH